MAGAATAIGSTSQNRAARSASSRSRPASSEPARTVRLEQTDELDDAGLAVGAIGEGSREADGAHAPLVERGRMAAARVVQVGAAAGHAGAEVGADGTEDDDGAAGHVLAAVRPDALDDGFGAGVADGEAHPRPADEVKPAAGRAVQHGVAGDRLGRRRRRRGPARARS